MRRSSLKILVLGHSNSDGSRLPNQADAWPWGLQRLLGQAGADTEIVHRLFIAGPTGAAFVERLLERERPDVTVVSTSTFGIAVQLVSNRVRERFGERAAALAVKAERFAARHGGDPGSRSLRAWTEARRTARRLIGTQGTVSAADLVRYYEEAFLVLARAENLHTIILLGPGYSREIHRLNPGSMGAQDSIQDRLKRSSAHHHFDCIGQESILGGPTEKLQYFQRDGVHVTGAAHERITEALLPLVLARL